MGCSLSSSRASVAPISLARDPSPPTFLSSPSHTYHRLTTPSLSRPSNYRHPLPQRASNLTTFTERLTTINLKAALRLILSHPAGRTAFRAYLASTFSDQHLSFILRCDHLLTTVSSHTSSHPDIHERALSIYQTFIKPGAVSEVNLPAALVHQLTPSEEGEAIDVGKFVQAREAVVDLLAFSCLKNFIRSEHFVNYRSQRAAEPISLNRTSRSGPDSFDLVAADLDTQVDVDVPDWLSQLTVISHALPVCICICDMRLPDRPIIFVNQEFTRVTGYSMEEVVGKSCRLLQGRGTSEETAKVMSRAFKMHEEVKVELKNYKKDGSEFVNLLTMKPMVDGKGRLMFYVAVQFDLSAGGYSPQVLQDLINTDPVIALLPHCLM
jgi:PAS domain S-box-containing protein